MDSEQLEKKSHELKREHDEYLRLLRAVSLFHPQIAGMLGRARQNRIDHLSQMKSKDRLAGLEELIKYLYKCQSAMEGNDSLNRIAFLVNRAIHDYAIAIEESLSGMRSVANDSMRDVMEIQYLLNDFRHESDHIELWLNARTRKERQPFEPGALRQREATRQGLNDPTKLPTASDYKGHSQAPHVNPMRSAITQKGILPPNRLSDIAYWEMYFHGTDLVEALLFLLEEHGVIDETSNPDVSLPIFKKMLHELRETEAEFWQEVLDGNTTDEPTGETAEASEESKAV